MIKIINLENLNKIIKTYFDRIVEDRNEADKIWLHLNHLKNEMEQIYTSYSNIADKAIITGEIVDRLAEYEDTGLAVEEIMQATDVDIPFDRLQQICEAERDGRCVVLPCKVGDTVYWADADGDEALELPLMGYWVTVFSDGEKKIDGCVQAFGRNWSKPFGTCLFLTREEAKQALKGGASK